MRDFTPDETQEAIGTVPFLHEAKAKDGWQGMSTTKSLETLKAEIGGRITKFTRGWFNIDDQKRAGYDIEYNVEGPDGKVFIGRFDVAALPVEEPKRYSSRRDEIMRNRYEHSLRMGLFNVVASLRAARILQQLSPGYNPLIPFMMVDDDMTLGEAWMEGAKFKKLQPPKPEEIQEGEFREVDDET